MECRTCKHKSDIVHIGIPYCKKCYSEIIWKRVRKEVRLLKIGRYSNITVSGGLSKFFLERIFSGSGKKVTVSKNPLIKEWFIEDTILIFFGGINSRRIKLFSSCTEGEIIDFCRFNNIKYKVRVWPESITLLSELELSYPGIKHGLMKSITDLKNYK